MPTRLLEDGIFLSDKVNQMTDLQFRVWVNLIVYVDDYGRGDARPAVIRGRCFPLLGKITEETLETAIKDLASMDAIRVYEADGKPYLYFPKWDTHQRIRNKRSKCPAPPGVESNLPTNDSNSPQLAAECRPNPIQSESNPNTKTRTREAVIAFDGSDVSEEIERIQKADSLIARYGLPDTDRSREALMEDLNTYDEDRVVAALTEAADCNSRGNKVSIRYYRAILSGTGRKNGGDGLPWAE